MSTRMTGIGATAALAALTVVLAGPASAAHTDVVQVQRTFTVGGITHHADVSGSGSSSMPPPVVAVPRRAIVTFQVDKKTVPFAAFQRLPVSAGRYAAFWWPALGGGWAEAADPGLHEKAFGAVTLYLGSGAWGPLQPGRRYEMLVAVDRAARLPMPFPMSHVTVRPARFPVGFGRSALPMTTPVGSVAVAGSMPNPVQRLPQESTAIAIDWWSDPSPVGEQTWEACRSPIDQPPCVDGGAGSYVELTGEFGGGDAERTVSGSVYENASATAAHVVGDGAAVDPPFNAATLFAFGMDPGQRAR